MAGHVDHRVGAVGQRVTRPDHLDHAVAGEQAATANLGPRIVTWTAAFQRAGIGRVHRAEQIGIADQQGVICHVGLLSSVIPIVPIGSCPNRTKPQWGHAPPGSYQKRGNRAVCHQLTIGIK